MDMRKQQARTGLFLLKEAVIDLIVEEAYEIPIQLDAIRKHLGILCQLREEGRVHYVKGSGWQITDKEFD